METEYITKVVNGKEIQVPKKKVVCELFNDSFQNWKKYLTTKAQLVLTDLPYCLGANAFGSNPQWYVGGGQQQWRK